MTSSPLPTDETSRLRALANLEVLDTAPEVAFDSLVRTAALVCSVPIALLSLVDQSRQWFKAHVGLSGIQENPRNAAFCTHAIHGDGLFEVPDATLDARFADNPLVTGQPDIRFYAGAPIRLSDGMRVGTLCIMDRQPRVLSSTQRDVLLHLSSAAATALEHRKALRQLEVLAEQKAQSERYLRVVVDNSPAMLAYWDRDLRCKFANQAYNDWFGITPDALVGQHIAQLLGPELYALNKPHMDAALGGQAQLFERVVVRSNGEQRHALAHYVPDIANQEVVGFLVHVTDVSDLKKAELCLRERIAEREQAQQLLRISNTLLRDTQRLRKIGSWTWNAATDVTTWSDEMYRIFGREPGAEAPGSAENSTLYSADSLVSLQAAVKAALKTGKPWSVELEVIRPDGSQGWLEAHGEVTRDGTGVVVGLQGTALDISERRELTACLEEQHEMLRVTLQSIGDAVITINRSGHVTWMNPVAEQMTGWLHAEALGRPHAQVFQTVDEITRQPGQSPVEVCLREGATASLPGRTLLCARNGREFGIEDSVAPIRNSNGQMVGVVLVFRDVTEQRRLHGEIRHQATHDPLTGLTNRAEFESRLTRTLDKAHAEDCEHVLMFIDLDHFKPVNDACGHAAGDQLLRQVARLFRDSVRGRDTLARVGGDEFAIILEHCTIDMGLGVAQQICDRMEDFGFVHDGLRFQLGASIGVVPLDKRWPNTAAVLQAADACCYAAKRAGRNRLQAWQDPGVAMDDRQEDAGWASRLECALARGGFVLHAQRMFALRGADTRLHAEVLLRLTNDNGGLIPPNTFLAPAERLRLCARIDIWVLRQVVDLLATRKDLSGIGTISVNLCAQSVGDREFRSDVVELLAATSASIRERLCLEFAETAVVTRLTDAARFIDEVRAFGVRMALGDFGVGASSPAYLKSLTIDLLKIDGQWVNDVIEHGLDDTDLRLFVDAVRRVGRKTVAELIDHPAVLARVKDLGVDYVQGRLLHCPEPLELVLRNCGNY